MIKKNSYNYQELINCGNGKLFGKGNAKLPLPVGCLGGVPAPVNGHFDCSLM